MGTTSRTRWYAVLVFVALCLCPLYSADAQNERVRDERNLDVVYSQLKWDLRYYEGLGYSFVNYIFGKLDDNGVATWDFELSRLTQYVVTGVCDYDCDDLDLRLKTAFGTVVDSDYEIGFWPQVSVTPSWSQSYSVEVIMYDCNVQPCYYGIALFEK